MVVTAFRDFDEGVVLRSRDNTARLLLRHVDGAKIRDLLVLQQRFNGRYDFRVAAGSQNAVHFGHLLHDFVLVPLGQAAGDQNLAHQALLFQLGGLQNVVDGLGLGGVNKPAGVDHHHVAAHNVLLDGVSGFLHPVHHPLAVHLIFRAAKGNKSNICHFLFLIFFWRFCLFSCNI